MLREHRAETNDIDYGIPLREKECYINQSDNTIRVGRTTLRKWRDLVEKVQRELHTRVPKPGLAVKLGSQQTYGILNELQKLTQQTHYTLRKILTEELAARYQICSVRGTNFLVRIL